MNLSALRDWMTGEDCVIVGCGPSARRGVMMPANFTGKKIEYPAHLVYEKLWTIGCNTSVPFCSPDFVVCVEPPRDTAMWELMRKANPLILFSHIEMKDIPRVVKIDCANVREWLTPNDPRPDDTLRLGQSPFFAAAVAIHLGFETIGLIGVDLTEDRYPDLRRPNKAWGELAAIATGQGSRIINLNPESRLETVEKGGWEEIKSK